MSSIGYLEGLQEQKAELQADLAAVERLIVKAKMATNGQVSEKPHKTLKLARPTPQLPLRPSRHVFEANPDSLASRVLSECRKVLDRVAGRALPFVNLCYQLPPELTSTSKKKQYVRLTLQRSGKRVGLEYVDATCVKVID